VKNCWILFVGKLMPCINKNWNDDAVKISSLLSKHTTPSDEAMAVTALDKKMNSWLNASNDVVEEPGSDSPMDHKRKTFTRDKWTDEDIEKFYDKQVDITRIRQDPITGKGWDLGYQNYLASMVTNAKKTTKNNNEILKQCFMDVEVDNSTVSSIKETQNTFNSEHCKIGGIDSSEVNYPIPVDLNDNDDE